MRSWRALCLAGAAVAVVTAGCSDREFEPPDPSVRVGRAATAYAATAFDTIGWASEDARRTEGNTIYAAECRRCHGPLGRGETEYAAARGLEVPSLVQPEWPLAQIDSVRRWIYVGHEAGMPSFGVRDLTPREIDAAAAYVLMTLRPEVLEEG